MSKNIPKMLSQMRSSGTPPEAERVASDMKMGWFVCWRVRACFPKNVSPQFFPGPDL